MYLQDRSFYIYRSLSAIHWKIIPYTPQEVAIPLANLTRLVAIGIQTLFYILIYAAMLLFKVLNERIAYLAKQGRFTYPQMSAELEKWRCHHDMVCRFVEKTNRCFSVILVLILCHTFVILSLSSGQANFIFSVTVNKPNQNQNQQLTALLLSGIQSFLRLFLVLVGSYRMQAHVSNLLKFGYIIKQIIRF